jgi:PUA-domain protein
LSPYSRKIVINSFSKIIYYLVVVNVPKRRRRHLLKEKEAKRFLLEIIDRLGIDIERLLGSKARVELDEIETAEIFIVNGRPLIARSDGRLFPTLIFEEFFSFIPEVVVDMGAVPYVCKGADVMAPGIVAVKRKFELDNLLLVVDERHGKPLAVGVALFSSEAMKKVNRGKTVKILHYVGDKLWNYMRCS